MSLRERLRNDLSDSEFRHAYADENLNLRIATQIKVLREQQKLSQKELAEKLGTKQAGISRLESADYSGWSVRVLKKLAEAFDLRLRISFEEFGTLWREVDQFSRVELERRPFKDDPEFKGPDVETHSKNALAAVMQLSGKASLLVEPNVLQQPRTAHDAITSIDQSPLWNRQIPKRTAQSALLVNSNGSNSNSIGGACI